MVKSRRVNPPTVLEDGKISHQEVEEVVTLALKVLKDMMLDTEASIETRFSIALRLFEMFGRDSKPNQKIALEEGIIRTLEKNAHDIERNAHHLTHIEALLQLANPPPPKNHEPVFQNRKNSHVRSTIIEHS